MRRHFPLLTIFLLAFFHGIAQRPFNDDYFLFDANKEVRINAMLQDEIGFMWVGTDIGLYRFNGQGDLYPVTETIHQPVTALYRVNGVTLAGFANGVFGRVVNDTFTAINIANAAPHHAIRDICEPGINLTCLATDSGLFALVNSTGFYIGGPPATSIIQKPGGNLWTATTTGIYETEMINGRFAYHRAAITKTVNEDSIRVLKRARAANFAWAGGSASGLTRIELNAGHAPPKTLRYSQGWRWGKVNDILVLDSSHVWASTDKGYTLDVTVTGSMHIRPYYYEGRKYTKLLRSASGNIWCGTAQGLSSLSAEFAASVSVAKPFLLRQLTAMACDKQNTMWFAQNNQLFRAALTGDTITPKPVAVLPSGIRCLYVDAGNELWIGTSGSGLWRSMAGAAPKKIEGSYIYAGKEIISISGASGGRIYVSGIEGVDELNINNGRAEIVKHHGIATGMSGNAIHHLYTDRSGRLWMANDSDGLCMYDGRQYHKWDSVSGLNAKFISSITGDAEGRIWAGSADNGLYRYDGKAWHHFTRENGLQDMDISTLVANKTGQLIIVNHEGVDEWYPRSVQFRHLNARTGPSIDSTSRALNCGATDTAGNVYVPTSTGFIVFKNITTGIELRPAVHINKVGIFLKPVRPSEHVFAHNQNHVSFQYEGINFVNIEPLNFRYRLNGYSDGWVSSTNENISFPQLAPGKYVFRLQTSLDKDFEEATEVTYAFEITPPLWARAWFVVLVLLGLLGLFYLYIKLRERRLKNVAQLKQERLLYEYEHLKSQVNPHFLFNSLNTLTNLIDEDPENAIEYTVQLSALYRNILTYRGKNTIFLSEECRLLSSYMHIQKRRFGDALELRADIPAAMMEDCKIIPLALQLLVENAINHNIATLEQPLIIYITVTPENDIIIRNRIRPKVSKETGAGLALQNIQKRYELLTRRGVSYGVTGDEYVVKLPLL